MLGSINSGFLGRHGSPNKRIPNRRGNPEVFLWGVISLQLYQIFFDGLVPVSNIFCRLSPVQLLRYAGVLLHGRVHAYASAGPPRVRAAPYHHPDAVLAVLRGICGVWTIIHAQNTYFLLFEIVCFLIFCFFIFLIVFSFFC